MKKTIYSLAIFMAAFATAQKKIDVKVSYGTPSLFGITESITGSIINVTTGSPAVVYDSNGVFAAEVMIQSESGKWQYGIGYNTETVRDNHYNFKENFHTILAQANYIWTNPQHKFRLYSGGGVGPLFTSFEGNGTKDNNGYFAFNITPVGIHYGEKLGVFLETNVGTKGFLQGGVSYTF